MDFFPSFASYDANFYPRHPWQQQLLRRQQQREADARERTRLEAQSLAYNKRRQQAYRKQKSLSEAQGRVDAQTYYDYLAHLERQKAERSYNDPLASFFNLEPSEPFYNFEESEDEYSNPYQDVSMTSPTVSESNSDSEEIDDTDSEDEVFYDSLDSSDKLEDEFVSEDPDNESYIEIPPTVVVYSTPQPEVEEDVTKRLQKMVPMVERQVETYERIRKAVCTLDYHYPDGYESQLNTIKSRLKVIQNAQIKLEQLYDQLDSIKTTRIQDKTLRTALIKKSVSTAEAIDTVIDALKERRNYYKQRLEEESSVSDYSGSDTSTSDIVYHVTLEDVPDADFSDS